MLTISKRKIPNSRFSLGVAVVGIGAGLFTISFGLELGRPGMGGSSLLFCIGLVVFLSGCFELVPECRMVERWDRRMIERALVSAPPESRIRVLGNWELPHQGLRTYLTSLLKEKGKEFNFEILLMAVGETDEPCGDLLDAAISLRAEDRLLARARFNAAIARLITMKENVDRVWREIYPGRKLALEIRSYRFMPFGPILQIGKSHLFAGLYLNQHSSVCGPMLVLRDPKSFAWRVLGESLKRGWEEGSEEVVFADRQVRPR